MSRPKGLTDEEWRERNRAKCQKYKSARRKEIAEKQRAYARDNPEKILAYTTSYIGHCRGTYARIKTRCEGRHNLAAVQLIYSGVHYCTWEEFWEWANRPAIKASWEALVARAKETGKRRDRPSIDRVLSDPGLGYSPSNMRWIAHGDNSTKACKKRWYGEGASWPRE